MCTSKPSPSVFGLIHMSPGGIQLCRMGFHITQFSYNQVMLTVTQFMENQVMCTSKPNLGVFGLIQM